MSSDKAQNIVNGLMVVVNQMGEMIAKEGHNTFMEMDMVFDAIEKIAMRYHFVNPFAEDEYYKCADKVINEVIKPKLKIQGDEAQVRKEVELLYSRILILCRTMIFDQKVMASIKMSQVKKSNIINPFQKN